MVDEARRKKPQHPASDAIRAIVRRGITPNLRILEELRKAGVLNLPNPGVMSGIKARMKPEQPPKPEQLNTVLRSTPALPSTTKLARVPKPLPLPTAEATKMLKSGSPSVREKVTILPNAVREQAVVLFFDESDTDAEEAIEDIKILVSDSVAIPGEITRSEALYWKGCAWIEFLPRPRIRCHLGLASKGVYCVGHYDIAHGKKTAYAEDREKWKNNLKKLLSCT